MWRNIKLLNFLYKRYKNLKTINNSKSQNKNKRNSFKKIKEDDYEKEFRREIIIFGVIAALCAIVPYVCALKSKNIHYTMPKIDMSQDNSLCTNCNVENCADRDDSYEVNDYEDLGKYPLNENDIENDSTISKDELVEFYENKINKLEDQINKEEQLNSNMRMKEIIRSSPIKFKSIF